MRFRLDAQKNPDLKDFDQNSTCKSILKNYDVIFFKIVTLTKNVSWHLVFGNWFLLLVTG
jgi:hypothetical protein